MVARPWKAYGVIELNGLGDDPWEAQFTYAVKRYQGLVDAAGVYVISTRPRTREKIRYIGMTHHQGFAREVFSPRNYGLVWNDLENERVKNVRVWLFAKPHLMRAGFSYDQRLQRQSLLLESLLIMHARAAGHQLLNSKKMQSADGMAVTGMFGALNGVGAPSAAAKELATLFGLRRA